MVLGLAVLGLVFFGWLLMISPLATALGAVLYAGMLWVAVGKPKSFEAFEQSVRASAFSSSLKKEWKTIKALVAPLEVKLEKFEKKQAERAKRREEQQKRQDEARVAEAGERAAATQAAVTEENPRDPVIDAQACEQVLSIYESQCRYLKKLFKPKELEGAVAAGATPKALVRLWQERVFHVPGVVIGWHEYHGKGISQAKILEEVRDKHIYMVGKSGMGKTELVRNMFWQDMADGHGVGLITPEAETITEGILPYIVGERLEDMIYFNPADEQCPVTVNPLHLDPGETLDFKVDENMVIFSRMLGDLYARMEAILRNLFYAFIPRPGSTLLDFYPMLSNVDFRREVLSNPAVSDETRRFWSEDYPNLPRDAYLPLTNRLERITRPQVMKRVLCNAQQPSLNLRAAMDQKKVLLFNLSDGLLGSENAQILGQFIISKFQQALMARALVPSGERPMFYLYVDEFQNFTGTAAVSYATILSRARKYRMALILAHQQTDQIPDSLLKEILGNVAAMIMFGVSFEDAQRLSKQFVKTEDVPLEYDVLDVIARIQLKYQDTKDSKDLTLAGIRAWYHYQMETPIKPHFKRLITLMEEFGAKDIDDFLAMRPLKRLIQVRPEDIVQLTQGQAWCKVENEHFPFRTFSFEERIGHHFEYQDAKARQEHSMLTETVAHISYEKAQPTVPQPAAPKAPAPQASELYPDNFKERSS